MLESVERRSFAYEDDRWRMGRFTVASVTMGGKTAKLEAESSCCDGGGDAVEVIVVVIGSCWVRTSTENDCVRDSRWGMRIRM